jgi:hypothetical protein
MSHYASADQVHLSQGTIYGSPQSHSPPCQAAGDAADLDAGDAHAVVAAVLDTAQSFAPILAFLQLSATPAAYIICLYIQHVLHYLFIFESTDVSDYYKMLDTKQKAGTLLKSAQIHFCIRRV